MQIVEHHYFTVNDRPHSRVPRTNTNSPDINASSEESKGGGGGGETVSRSHVNARREQRSKETVTYV